MTLHDLTADPDVAAAPIARSPVASRSAASALVRDLLMVSACRADPAVVEAALSGARVTGPGATVRSCIDGGAELIASLSAPGGRRLGLYARQPEPHPVTRSGPGCHGRSRWAWWKGGTGEPARTGWRHLFSGERAGTWIEIEAAVAGAAAVDRDRLRRWHAVLGPNGRIYSVSGTDGGPIWVAWQLDGRVPVDRALDALGVDGTVGRATIAGLLGSTVGVANDSGPWSVAVAVGTDRWRLGTSRWARSREDQSKRRRLADTADAAGGDGRFAEAAYKLVQSSRPGAALTRIGRAVEVELPVRGTANRPLDVEFFLTAPTGGTPT